jgi:hypothetical protein
MRESAGKYCEGLCHHRNAFVVSRLETAKAGFWKAQVMTNIRRRNDQYHDTSCQQSLNSHNYICCGALMSFESRDASFGQVWKSQSL